MVPLGYSAYRSSMTRYDICEGYDIYATPFIMHVRMHIN